MTTSLQLLQVLCDVHQGVPLKRYVIQEVTENRVTYYFRAPLEGDYYFTVYAQAVGTDQGF